MAIQHSEPVELYAHEPSSLIPLLSKHLPRSLPVLASIQESLPVSSSWTSTSTFTPSPNASSRSKSSDAGKAGALYATFPPDQIPISQRGDDGEDERLWGVVFQNTDPTTIHLRLFCSAETSHPSSGPHDDESGPDNEPTEERIQDFVSDMTRAMVRVYGKRVILGSVDSRWNQVVREAVDSEDFGECTVFLAPPYLLTEKRDAEDEERVEGLGLEFDQGREGDLDIVSSSLFSHHRIIPDLWGIGALALP